MILDERDGLVVVVLLLLLLRVRGRGLACRCGCRSRSRSRKSRRSAKSFPKLRRAVSERALEAPTRSLRGAAAIAIALALAITHLTDPSLCLHHGPRASPESRA
jgi:hypothetical protein